VKLDQNKLLVRAILDSKIVLVKQAIEKGANVNAIGLFDGYNMLDVSLYVGNKAIILEIMRHNPETTTHTSEAAKWTGDEEIAEIGEKYVRQRKINNV
jgi:hypothetical protein